MHHDKKCGPGGMKCGCPYHSMMGIFVILFGVVFLLKNLGVISENVSQILWPSVVILAGLKKVCKGMCKCCSKGEAPKV